MEEIKRFVGIIISASTIAVIITIFIYQNFTTKSEAQTIQSEVKETREEMKDNKEEILKRLDRIENKIDHIYSEFK